MPDLLPSDQLGSFLVQPTPTFDMTSKDLPSRVDQLRHSTRSISRLTASTMIIQDAGISDDGVWAIPFLWAWRWIQRRRIERRLPAVECKLNVIAAYARPEEDRLRPWPGRVSRCDHRIIFHESGIENEIDLTAATLEALCDGIAWIDVRRGHDRQLTLAIYAPEERIFDVLGVRCRAEGF